MKISNLILENEMEVSENTGLRNFFKKALVGISSNDITAVRTINSKLADDIAKIFNARSITGYDDDINRLIGDLAHNSKNLTQQAMGDIMTGIMKTKDVSDDLIKSIVPAWVDDKRFISAWTQEGRKLTKSELIKKGYTPKAAEEILSYAKKSHTFQTALKGGGKSGMVGGTKGAAGSKASSSSFKEMIKKYSGLNYIKEVTKPGSKVRKFIFSKAAIVGLMAIGGVGYLLKSMFGDSDLRDENGNDVYKMLDGKWLPCIKNLVNSKQGKYVKLSNGSIGVQVTNDQYPNSIIFYDNGRVLDGKTKKMGTYKCKDGQIQQTNEQNTNNEIYTDVNTMIDLLDFPSTTQDLRDAVKLLEKYTTNGQGQRFLELYKSSGTGGGDLSKSLKYLYVKEPESVDNRNKMYSLIKQIQSGSTTKTIDSGGNTGSIDDIEITWDNNPTGSTKGGSSSTKKSIYHNCGKKDFPFEFGCINPKIGQLQQCLGVSPTKGYFGPKTLNALKNDGFDMSRRLITKDLFDAVIAKCEPTVTKSAEKNTDKILSDKFGVDTKIPDELRSIGKTTSTEPISGNKSRLQELLASPNMRIRNGGDVYIWKGSELSGEDYYTVNKYLTDKGYRLVRQREIGDENVKYKWKK